jgi:hypothetical protein
MTPIFHPTMIASAKHLGGNDKGKKHTRQQEERCQQHPA